MSVSLVVIVVLVLGVVFVNGWTDAPNAIATAVSTRVLRPRFAIMLSVVFNFLGAFVMTYINASVAETVSKLVDFGDNKGEAGIALAAALFAIVVWAVAAWYFGIPTSESHALIAGITGAAIALPLGIGAVNGGEWIKVLWGLCLSSFIGFGSGFGAVKLIEIICKKMNRSKTTPFFAKGQAAGAAAMSFLHGAQDGQKFMGVFMLGLFLHNMADTNASGGFDLPLWLILLCSVTMGLGTSIGGYRIIKSVGMDMVKLEKYQGFAADVAASCCLLFASLTGTPVSTTHTKTTAIMGVGLARRKTAVDWGIVREMGLAWVLTFPGCGLIGFLMSKLFLMIF